MSNPPLRQKKVENLKEQAFQEMQKAWAKMLETVSWLPEGFEFSSM